MVVLVLAGLATARLGMCIPAIAYVLNQTNISFIAMAISYTVIFSIGYIVLLGTMWKDKSETGDLFEKIKTQMFKSKSSMATIFLFDYIVFMAWMWRWLDKHNRMGLGRDAPTTENQEFCSAQYMMQLFVIVGLMYFTLTINYIVVRWELATPGGMERRGPFETFKVRSNPAYMTFVVSAAFMYLVAILYTSWMFFMSVGLPPRIDVDGFFWIWITMLGLWVFSTVFFTIFSYRMSSQQQQGTVNFWADLITSKLFWILYHFYNMIFYINAFEKEGYKTGATPKFQNGAPQQNQLFVAWQPFTVINGVLLPYMIYYFVSMLALGWDIKLDQEYQTHQMQMSEWSKFTKSAVQQTMAVSILGGFTFLAGLYQVLHAFFIFSELLETPFLNTRLEAWAIAYTVIFGALVAVIIIGFMAKFWGSTKMENRAPRTRASALRIFFTLLTIYFMGVFFYWYGVNKFNATVNCACPTDDAPNPITPCDVDSLHKCVIRDSSTKVSFYWWNLLGTMFGLFFVGLLVLREAFANYNLTEFGKDVKEGRQAAVNPTELVPTAITEGAGDVAEAGFRAGEGAVRGSGQLVSRTARSTTEFGGDVTQGTVGLAGQTVEGATSFFPTGNKYAGAFD